MKLRILLLSILFAVGTTTIFAQSTQSDYEIQKAFKAQYAEFENQIETTSSPDSIQQLIASIKQFDEKYQSHSELLNKALYPETYKQQMEELKKSSVIAKDRLQTIEQQTQKMQKLETQLADYEQNINQLDKQTDSLKEAMQKSIQSEKQLADMLREYRNNLEKRDELILTFIDSMVVTYQKMDLQALQDLENIDKKSRFESNGNALKMIHDISDENLSILERNTDKLRLQDYMRMAEVHQQFEMMWSRLGDKIQQVYNGKNAESLAKQVDRNINQWNSKLKAQAYAALEDTLAHNNIQTNSFQSSEEFYSALSSYLDAKIKESKENRSEAGYNNFKAFQDFWNRVEMQWSSNFVDAGLISKPQMATLNQKVDTWAEQAQPRSNNILVYLLGGSVLLAVALGVMLIREKKTKPTA